MKIVSYLGFISSVLLALLGVVVIAFGSNVQLPQGIAFIAGAALLFLAACVVYLLTGIRDRISPKEGSKNDYIGV